MSASHLHVAVGSAARVENLLFRLSIPAGAEKREREKGGGGILKQQAKIIFGKNMYFIRTKHLRKKA